MMRNLLVDAIRETFLTRVGKFQLQKNERKAGKLVFCIRHREGEEGYRDRELLIYAPGNYVEVYERETWDVIPENELEWGENGEDARIKKGSPGYRTGKTDWKQIANHDSCWVDGIDDFLRRYEKDIICFGGGGDWFEVVNIGDEIIAAPVCKFAD